MQAFNTIHATPGLPAKARVTAQSGEAAAQAARDAAETWLADNPRPAPMPVTAPQAQVTADAAALETTMQEFNTIHATPGLPAKARVAAQSGEAAAKAARDAAETWLADNPPPAPTPPAPPVPTPPPTPPTPPTPPAPTPPAPPPVPNGPGGAWTLVFDDEFNGDSLDTTTWTPDWFGGGSMNNVSTDPANVSVADGCVQLGLSSSSVGALISTNPHGGASRGFQFTEGFAEARILFPGSGETIDNWPAWWTVGQEWPQDGEIDIAEGLGTLTSNYHSSAGANNSNTIPGDWAGGFHTYGVNRQAGKNDIYWDGVLIRSYSTDDGNAPHYLIVNVGVGDGPTVLDTPVQVDYVRVWQLSSS